MRLLRPTSEDEMIAVFLKSEIASQRFGQKLIALLERDGKDCSIVEAPDIHNIAENAYRRQLLGDFRGYGQNRNLFENFPEQVSWYRITLDREEVAKIKYIDYSYWNELSNGTRLPVDATKTILAGKKIYGQSNESFIQAAQALCQGTSFPELIVVGASPQAELIILEGHLRLTAYMLAFESLPDSLEVIAGFAPRFAQW